MKGSPSMSDKQSDVLTLALRIIVNWIIHQKTSKTAWRLLSELRVILKIIDQSTSSLGYEEKKLKRKVELCVPPGLIKLAVRNDGLAKGPSLAITLPILRLQKYLKALKQEKTIVRDHPACDGHEGIMNILQQINHITIKGGSK